MTAPTDTTEKSEGAGPWDEASPGQAQRHLEVRMEDISTLRSSYPPPPGPGLRERGIRRELLEKMITQSIRFVLTALAIAENLPAPSENPSKERVLAEFNPETPATDFTSTTQRDFSYRGHLSPPPKPSKSHDYKRDQAVTFWSENRQHIQRNTTVRTADDAPFKRSALFSTPITQRLDDQ